MKKNSGIKRIILAAGYSCKGLLQAFRYEAAFRQELMLVAVLLPLAFFLEVEPVSRVLMVSTLMLILIVELLNSAIEAVVDRIGTGHHELSGRAKDMGSAAVLITLLLTAYVWLSALWPLLQ